MNTSFGAVFVRVPLLVSVEISVERVPPEVVLCGFTLWTYGPTWHISRDGCWDEVTGKQTTTLLPRDLRAAKIAAAGVVADTISEGILDDDDYAPQVWN